MNQRSKNVRNAITHLYRQIAFLPVSWENFHNATVAVFEPCPIPDRTPDFVSPSRSAYWAEPDGVIRVSNHWGGGIKSCDWYIRGDHEGCGIITSCCDTRAGFCTYENFTKVVWVDRRRLTLTFDAASNTWKEQ